MLWLLARETLVDLLANSKSQLKMKMMSFFLLFILFQLKLSMIRNLESHLRVTKLCVNSSSFATIEKKRQLSMTCTPLFSAT